MSAETLILPPANTIPLVGRQRERQLLSEALDAAIEGRGSTWLLEGEGGIGKTRLATWLEDEARRRGLPVRWGRCLKEVLTPFLPWKEVFHPGPARAGDGESEAGADLAAGLPSDLPSVLLVEEKRRAKVRDKLGSWVGETPCLVLTREHPSTIRERVPRLGPVKMVWLSRVESDESISAGNLDDLARRIEEHLRSASGAVVLLEGLEYLVNQNSFGSVLSLLQVVRDVAEETQGHVIVSAHPASFAGMELGQLETLGTVEWSPPGRRGTSGEVDTARPASLVFLDLLDRLEAASTQVPRVILLDDFQWGDPSSLAAFQFLARNLRNLPVLLVATVRTNEQGFPDSGPESGAKEILDKMLSDRSAVALRIGGLPGEDALHAVQELLPLPLDEGGQAAEFRSFVDRSGGNPYLLLTATRMLAEEGWLRKDRSNVTLRLPEGEGLRQVLPKSVRDTIHRRLALLSPDEREVLDLAAVQGEEFEPAVLGDVLQKPSEELREVLSRLQTGHRFVRDLPESPGTLIFHHPLAWESVLAEMPVPERQGRALRLARWWASHRPSEVDVAARLFHEAEEPREGLPWVERALSTCLARGSLDLAERYATWRLDLESRLGVGAEDRVRSGIEVGKALVRTSRYPAVVRLAQRLEAERPGVPLLWEVRMLLVQGLFSTDMPRARLLLETTQEEVSRASEPPPAGLLARLEQLWGTVSEREGRMEETRRHALRSLELLGGSGDPGVRCRALEDVSWVLVATGRADEAPPFIEEGLRTARGAGLLREEAKQLHVEAFRIQSQGDPRTAAERYLELARKFHDLGDASGEATCLCNAGEGFLAVDAWSEATASFQGTEVLAKKFGFPGVRSPACCGLGIVKARQGLWKEAIPLLQESCEIARATGFAEFLESALSYLCECRARLGELGPAREAWEEARTRARDAQLESRVLFERVTGVLQLREGDRASARAALTRALDLAKGGGAWGEQMEVWKDLSQLESAEGNSPQSQEAWSRRNALRLQLRMPPLPWNGG